MSNTFRKIYMFLRTNLLGVDPRSQIQIAIDNGLKLGHGCEFKQDVIIDPGHCWLIEIGNHVTLAPRVHVLAHDASTKRLIGFTRIAKVKIGDNVFVGAGTIILPGVTIGSNVVIGAGSIVTHDIPDNSLAFGNPCTVIKPIDVYIREQKEALKECPVFGKEYIIGNITDEMKEDMRNTLEGHRGFII